MKNISNYWLQYNVASGYGRIVLEYSDGTPNEDLQNISAANFVAISSLLQGNGIQYDPTTQWFMSNEKK